MCCYAVYVCTHAHLWTTALFQFRYHVTSVFKPVFEMFISHIRKVNILVLGQPVLNTGTRLPGELCVFAPDALSQGLAEKIFFVLLW